MSRRYTPLSISSDLKVALTRLERKSAEIMRLSDDLSNESATAVVLIQKAREDAA